MAIPEFSQAYQGIKSVALRTLNWARVSAGLILALLVPQPVSAMVVVYTFVDYPAANDKYRVHAVYQGEKIPILAQLQRKTMFGNWKNANQFSLALPQTNYPSAATFTTDLKYWVTIGGDDYAVSCFGTRTKNDSNQVEIRIYQLPEGKLIRELNLNDLIPSEEVAFWLEKSYAKRVRPPPVAIPEKKAETIPLDDVKPTVSWNSTSGILMVRAEGIHHDAVATTSITRLGGSGTFALSMGAKLNTENDGMVLLESFWGRKISIDPATGRVVINVNPEFDFHTIDGTSAIDMMRKRENFTLHRHLASWLEDNGDVSEIPELEALYLAGDSQEGWHLLSAMQKIDPIQYFDFLARQLETSSKPEFRRTAINRLTYAQTPDESRRGALFKLALRDRDEIVRHEGLSGLIYRLAQNSEPVPPDVRNDLLVVLRDELKKLGTNYSDWHRLREIHRVGDLEALRIARDLLSKAEGFYEKEKRLKEIDDAMKRLTVPAP